MICFQIVVGMIAFQEQEPEPISDGTDCQNTTTSEPEKAQKGENNRYRQTSV